MYRILFRNDLDDDFGYAVPFTPLRNFPLVKKEHIKCVLRHLNKVSPYWMNYTAEEVKEEQNAAYS